MQIGFIGLGTMGAHMAANAQAGGYALIVNDLNQAAAAPHIKNGARWAANRLRFAFRREMRAVERLAHINIAKSCNQFLIQERGFERRLFALKFRADQIAIEFIAKRLEPVVGPVRDRRW